MSKVILYIAKSIDGFIARNNGSIDWLESIANPNQIDHGYLNLLNSINSIIMGRKTYETLMEMDIEWPYIGYETYIVSSNSSYLVKSPDTFLVNTDIETLIKKLKTNNTKNIWLVGGGQLVNYFLNANLIDRMIISVVPVLLGEGISLFAGKSIESGWELENAEAFETGIVNLTYNKIR